MTEKELIELLDKQLIEQVAEKHKITKAAHSILKQIDMKLQSHIENSNRK